MRLERISWTRIFTNVKISVIIPIFNCEKYLDTCIRSVLMQDYQDYEIICVDDKSTDGSLDLLKQYAKYDERIKILANDENKGPGYCRNRALDVAKGKYIFFLDGDDWIEKETLGLLYAQCEKDKLDLIMFKYISYYDDKKEFGHEPYYDMEYLDKYSEKVFNHWDLIPRDVFRLPLGPCNKLYKKSFLNENNIRFPDGNLIQEDNPFFFKIITLAKRISMLNKYFYIRRRRVDSIMGALDDERLFSRIYIAEIILQYFLSNDQLYNHYKKNLHNTISIYVLNVAYDNIKDELKKEMYISIHNLYTKFFDEYDIKDDVMEYVNEEFLIKFGLIDD